MPTKLSPSQSTSTCVPPKGEATSPRSLRWEAAEADPSQAQTPPSLPHRQALQSLTGLFLGRNPATAPHTIGAFWLIRCQSVALGARAQLALLVL